jgi:hypothetical protein
MTEAVSSIFAVFAFDSVTKTCAEKIDGITDVMERENHGIDGTE